MHRAILIQCLPAFIALTACFLALSGLVKFSGARLNLRRLRELPECQDGGVQSLSFVMTLPLFIMIVMLIVQISQLMIGMIAVNYAAFAAARAALVWIPAEVGGLAENKMPGLTADRPLRLVGADSYSINEKQSQILSAAALACAPISSSRDLHSELTPQALIAAEVTQALYLSMVPDSSRNSRIPRRLENKLAYSYANTWVEIRFRDKDTVAGPTYNPWVPVRVDGQLWRREWDPNEVGWQDPITVTVYHNFALLPGPGRFLAKHIVGSNGAEDRVSRRIQRSTAPSGDAVYTTLISASATLTNEGLKSILPYEEQTY